MEFRLASAAFIVVFAVYLFLGGMGVTERDNPSSKDAAYNLLARGLLAGHLSLDKETPPALAGLGDPYDPETNRDLRLNPLYRLNDLSYYRGRLYLYFGIAPALLLFLPWHLLTGGWMAHWVAVALLCSAGLAANLSLVHAVRRRNFPAAPAWILGVCTLVLGLGSYAPLLAARGDMWEIPIAFSYLCVSIALRAIWEVLGNPAHAVRWLALGSAAMGAAFAARPTVLPNAALLLLPFLDPQLRRSPRAWSAAVVPLTLGGAGVALYNFLRFGSPVEFGVRYQLAGVYVAKLHAFSPTYVGTNLGFYLFQPVRWSSLFPFVHEPLLGPLRAHLPVGHGGVEQISGALLNAPILWAAAAVPFLLRSGGTDHRLARTCAAAAWVAASSLLLLSFFFGACSRYQFEFVPELAFLAAVGVMALESAPAGRLRTLARIAWIPALAISCAFPVLYGIERCVSDHNYYGVARLRYGDNSGARHEFGVAQSLSPRNPFSRMGNALVLESERKPAEAQKELEDLVRDFPDDAPAHFGLGNLLLREGHPEQALANLQEAHRLDPENASMQAALASALKGAK